MKSVAIAFDGQPTAFGPFNHHIDTETE